MEKKRLKMGGSRGWKRNRIAGREEKGPGLSSLV